MSNTSNQNPNEDDADLHSLVSRRNRWTLHQMLGSLDLKSKRLEYWKCFIVCVVCSVFPIVFFSFLSSSISAIGEWGLDYPFSGVIRIGIKYTFWGEHFMNGIHGTLWILCAYLAWLVLFKRTIENELAIKPIFIVITVIACYFAMVKSLSDEKSYMNLYDEWVTVDSTPYVMCIPVAICLTTMVIGLIPNGKVVRALLVGDEGGMPNAFPGNLLIITATYLLLGKPFGAASLVMLLFIIIVWLIWFAPPIIDRLKSIDIGLALYLVIMTIVVVLSALYFITFLIDLGYISQEVDNDKEWDTRNLVAAFYIFYYMKFCVSLIQK